MIKFNDICGMMNFVSSSDFFMDFVPLHGGHIKIVVNEEDKEAAVRIKISDHNEDVYNKYVETQIDYNSFLNIQSHMDSENYDFNLLSPYNLVYGISNNFDIDILLGFASVYDSRLGELHATLVFHKDNRLFCAEVKFSDLICMNYNNDLPIYIKKDIFEKYGKSEDYDEQ